jgi:hypothetical protein
MGATSCCNASADKGAACPEYPVDAGGAGCWPAASNGTEVMTSKKDNAVDKSCFVKVLIIIFSDTPSHCPTYPNLLRTVRINSCTMIAPSHA